ncbi:MAG: hypothetical protein K8S99_13640 [Planctomycetes bacterium]|nr:hypothetical protein [Planctomycetota bacterium]
MRIAIHSKQSRNRRGRRHQRGAAAVLAMMFLVIFSSLAAAMAIVSQGNLTTADSQMKISRSLAGAETGLRFMIYRINLVTPTIKTKSGLIDSTTATSLWTSVRTALAASFANEPHNIAEPVVTGTSLKIGPIAVAPGEPQFTATLTPHPLTGENYSSAYYQRPPYSQMVPAVSSSKPLDNTWVRIRVECADGPAGHKITRSIQMDLRLEKKIKYAILSKNRLMIGQNVMIQGPIGSKFTETSLANGNPVQIKSDFFGLDSTLDQKLTAFYNTLKTNNPSGDNRINLSNSTQTAGITNPAQYDTNHDGYISEYDFFLAHYDKASKGYINATDMDTGSNVRAAQIFSLIDTFGDPTRTGYNDGKIDDNDRYAKIRGEVMLSTDVSSWNNGAAGGDYLKYVQGLITPDAGQSALAFQSSALDNYTLAASDFDVSAYRALATGDLAAQATQQAQNSPGGAAAPSMDLTGTAEAVPYGAAHPYDMYTRPVYKNMTFTNVKIPKGSNALFINCKFIGCTFVETTTANTDANYNYVGMVDPATGSYSHYDKAAVVNGQSVTDTKPLANNIRFDDCKFEGGVVTDVPSNFTQVRNKLAFTGTTVFDPNAASLTDTQKALFQRSTLLAPQYSVELGTFTSPNDSTETVKLTGTIVAGIIDMRGQVTVDGSLLTTFAPAAGSLPMLGNESPDYNTTLGYFGSSEGDKEEEMPASGQGLGKIQIRYNGTRPLPDGILGPIQLTPNLGTYSEGGAQ